MKGQNKGFRRVMMATVYSWKGLKATWKHEEAFRQEVVLFVLLIPVALWLGESPVEYALLFGSLLLVLIIELLNSAVEAVVDRFGGDIHKLSGRAKDMGSAAVMLGLLNVVIVWGLLLYERL